MSRLVERVARRLAQPAHAVAALEPAETGTNLITRRQASRRAAAAGALTITAATALGPWTGDAAAEGYCFSDCVNNAENELNQSLDNLRSNLLHRAAHFSYWLGVGTGGVTGYLSAVYGDYYENRAGCALSNCGDPARYPPPKPGGGGTQGCGSGCVDCGAPPAGTYCACAGAVCCACGKECTYAQYCVGCCAT
jgi:hypothetical protein